MLFFAVLFVLMCAGAVLALISPEPGPAGWGRFKALGLIIFGVTLFVLLDAWGGGRLNFSK